MKSNVAVTDYSWADEDSDITILDFTVYKKGLFGGMKPDRKFAGWSLCFKHINGSEVDLEYVSLQDGNAYTQPTIPGLVHAVFLAGASTLKNSGEEQKAKILNQAAIGYFKKNILKKS